MPRVKGGPTHARKRKRALPFWGDALALLQPLENTAQALADDPVVPLRNIAAILNLDVVNLYGRTRDVSALGLDQSSTNWQVGHVTLPEDTPLAGKPVRSLQLPVDSALVVSVNSSTICAVISDSSRPTSAMVRANGAMIRKVSRSSGTSGKNSEGRDSGSSPLSPTLGTSMPIGTTIAVITTMVTSGAGTTPVSRGNRNTMARPRAVSG